jgi:hypothetical protein
VAEVVDGRLRELVRLPSMPGFVHLSFAKGKECHDCAWFSWLLAHFLSHVPIYLHFEDISFAGTQWGTEYTLYETLEAPLFFMAVEFMFFLRHMMRWCIKCCDRALFGFIFLFIAEIVAVAPLALKMFGIRPFKGYTILYASGPCIGVTAVIALLYIPMLCRRYQERKRMDALQLENANKIAGRHQKGKEAGPLDLDKIAALGDRQAVSRRAQRQVGPEVVVVQEKKPNPVQMCLRAMWSNSQANRKAMANEAYEKKRIAREEKAAAEAAALGLKPEDPNAFVDPMKDLEAMDTTSLIQEIGMDFKLPSIRAGTDRNMEEIIRARILNKEKAKVRRGAAEHARAEALERFEKASREARAAERADTRRYNAHQAELQNSVRKVKKPREGEEDIRARQGSQLEVTEL